MERSKRRKDNHDRVSNLPDVVLHDILSFLPSKYAVSTSVLSTRWKYLWTSIHNLEFFIHRPCLKNRLRNNKSSHSFPESVVYSESVDRVLFNIVVSRINKFRLKSVDCEKINLDQWISTLIRCKVEEIDLIVLVKYPLKMLLKCLFTCDTLRILKLEMTVRVENPCLIQFSNLKILHFIRISFSAGGSTTEGISLNSPVLEELVISGCQWLKISSIDVSSPALQLLTIDGIYRNVRIVKIGAERLRSIKLHNLYHCKFFLCDLSSLVEASVCHTCGVRFHNPGSFPHCLFASALKILKIAMPLSVNIHSFTNFSTVKVMDLKYIAFHNEQANQELFLTCLVLEELVLYYCTWTKIKTVTISAPKLRMLRIEDREHTFSSDDNIDCEIKFNAPSMVSLTLIAYHVCKYSLSHQSSLVDASIHVSGSKVVQCEPLLRGIYNVKELKLSLYSIESLSLPDVSTNMHTFSRLTCLTLQNNNPHIKHVAIFRRRFIDLLADMPNLEHLFIRDLSWLQRKGNGRIIGKNPQAFLSRLKFVKVEFTSWIMEELWFVNFLIKNLCHELTISLSPPFDNGTHKMNSEKLEEIAKRSKCVIQYH